MAKKKKKVKSAAPITKGKSALQKYELPLKLAVLAFMIISSVCVIVIPWSEGDISLINDDTLSYVRAEVLSIDEENLSYDSMETDRLVGTQHITVEILSGEMKGEVMEVTNYMTRSVNVYCSVGKVVMVCLDMPDNADPYVTVFNYDRVLPLVLIMVAFILIVLAVGRKTGIWSLLGLGYTVVMIIFFLARAIFSGWNSIITSAITITVTASAALFLLCGPNKKMVTSLCSTLGGILMSAVFYFICSKVLHISGYNLDEAETLLMINSSTGMSLKGLIMCAVLITSFGAVMDVSVSISSSLMEIHEINPEMQSKELLKSGLNIGRDMVGTMTNTLILAYAGGALVTILVLLGYGYGWSMLSNSDYLAMEIAQGISSTVGVVLTVPLASVICSRLYAGKEGTPKKAK